jgi:hypothetical protein
MTANAPTDAELAACLGAALPTWQAVIAAAGEQVGPLDLEWKPSKQGFGRVCLLKKKKRTLLYLTPEPGAARVAVVLGERALGLALAADLPEALEARFREARHYAEGTCSGTAAPLAPANRPSPC